MLAEADASTDGHVKTRRLEQAAKFARRYHLADIHQECVRRLQSVDPASFNWITIRSEVGVRASDIESYLRTFDRPSLMEALYVFFETPAPSGSREKNEEMARQMLSESIALSIFGSGSYGAHGLPQQSHDTEEKRLQYQLANVEAMAMGSQGIILATALDRMKLSHGIPEREDLHSWLVDTYGSDPGLCMSLASSLTLYWHGEFLACIQLAMPRIEAAVRALLLLLDEPIYRVEEGKSPGQFPGLGFMLPQLEKNGFDADWSAFLRSLLLIPGKNLRNLGAHGFLQDVDNKTAALVIRALGVVALLAPEESSAKAGGTPTSTC